MSSMDDVLAVAHLRAQLRNDICSGRARQIREKAGLTQSEVARAIDVSQAAIAKWETGKRTPTGNVAERYAALLYRLGQVTQEAL